MCCPSIVSWNCRGVGSRIAVLHLLDLVKSVSHDILILIETRVPSSYVSNFIGRTIFTHYVAAEANGFAGDIWILWNCAKVELEVASLDAQIINAFVKYGRNQFCLLSAVYASPKPVFHQVLWEYLVTLGRLISIPWLLLGDFNQVLFATEKHGGCPVTYRHTRHFATFISDCALVDLGFSGPPFTWTNMRQGRANIKERLDRGLGNQAWIERHPHCLIRHLPRSRSDHLPILLCSSSRPQPRVPSSFRVLLPWLDHPSFSELVEDCWRKTDHAPLLDRLSFFRSEVTRWNSHVLGNIFERKARCRARLGGIQRRLCVEESVHYRRLE